MKQQRLVAVTFVGLAIAASVVYSFPGTGLTPSPAVTVASGLAPNAFAISMVMLTNPNPSPVSVASLGFGPACDGSFVTTSPMPPYTVAASGTKLVSVQCANIPANTIKRCQFQLLDGTGMSIANYTDLCVGSGTTGYGVGSSLITFTTPSKVTSAPQTAMITAPFAQTKVSVQIDDQDNIFALTNGTCGIPWGCNDMPVAVNGTQTFPLTFTCTPPTSAQVLGHAYILGDTGARTVINLDCNPSGGAGPTLDITPMGSVSLSTQFGMTVGSNVVLTEHDGSAIGMITITSVTIDGAGASRWTPTIVGNCAPSIPPTCTLPSGAFTTVHLAYSPSAPGSIDQAKLHIFSSDATNGGSAEVALNGSGAASNAAISVVSTTPSPFALTAPVNGMAVGTIQILDSGSDPVTAVSYTISPLDPALSVTGPSSISSNGTATAQVTCSPKANGTVNANVVITAPNTLNSPLSVPVSCGTPPKINGPATFALSTRVMTLGTGTLSLTNTGASPLVISNVITTGGNGWSATLQSPCAGTTCTVAPGGSVVVDLMFSPSTIGTANDATLTISSNDPSTPNLAILLDGTGLGATLALHQPTLLDFGDVTVNTTSTKSFLLDNAGNIALDNVTYSVMQLGSELSFGTTVNPLPPASSNAITAKCQPTTEGTFSGQLQIGSTEAVGPMSVTVSVTCRGVAVTPGPTLKVDLDPVMSMAAVGSFVDTTEFFGDTGGMPLTVTKVEVIGAGWSLLSTTCASCVMPANTADSANAVLRFAPTMIGAAPIAVFKITTVELPVRIVMLLGTGLGATLELPNAPVTLDFGTLSITSSATKTFQLANHGNTTLTGVQYMLAGPYTQDGPATLSVGVTDVHVTCHPTVVGNFDAAFAINSSAAVNPPGLVNVSVKCSGQSGALVATPPTLEFGEIRIGDTAPRTLEGHLASSSTTSLVVTIPPTASPIVPGLVIGGQSITQVTATPMNFDLVYTPPAIETAFSTLVTTTAGNPATIMVTGKVVTPAVDASTDTEVSLGTFCAGGQPTPTTVMLHAAGTATLRVAQPTVTGPFTLTDVTPSATGYPYALPSTGSIAVAVTPALSAATGHVIGTVVWNADLPTPATTPIAVDFLDQSAAPSTKVLDFDTIVNAATLTKVVAFRSCNPTPLQVASVTVEPDGVFTIDSPMGSDLPPEAVGAVGVSFHPTHVGVVEGTLTVTFLNRTPIAIELHAMARGGDGTSGTPNTFYGCGCRSSAGGRDAGSAGALGLAIALVLRRRRARR